MNGEATDGASESTAHQIIGAAIEVHRLPGAWLSRIDLQDGLRRIVY
jgi:hypothetical protein